MDNETGKHTKHRRGFEGKKTRTVRGRAQESERRTDTRDKRGPIRSANGGGVRSGVFHRRVIGLSISPVEGKNERGGKKRRKNIVSKFFP